MQTPTTLYVDYAATTPLADEVVEAMLPWSQERFANASGMYAAAREARKAVDESRERLAEVIGARPDEIVFTSGGTEADNLAIKGGAWHLREQGRDGVVVGAIEHHAVLDPARWLARSGFRVTEVPVTADGIVDVAALEAAVDSRTAIVSIMRANNEIGTVQPVERAAEIARAAGAMFHTDAVQALAWLDLRSDDADLMSLAAHKCHGPKGVGALVVRRGAKIQPLLHGGGQERGLRSSTYNTAGIVGFGAAAAYVDRTRETESARIEALRDGIEQDLLARCGGARVNGAAAPRLPGCSSICFDGIDSESLLLLLDAAGVAASAGSACSSGAAEPSYVLTAMGVPPKEAAGVLRLTLGRPTTATEVAAVADRVVDAVARLRA